MADKPRFAPVPHLSVRRSAPCDRPALTTPLMQEYVKGDQHWRKNPLPDYDACRCVRRAPAHLLRLTRAPSFRCEEEFVLVNIVRNAARVRGLSGAVATPVSVEGAPPPRASHPLTADGRLPSRRSPLRTRPSPVVRSPPSQRVFFRPEEVKAAIVTCGGTHPTSARLERP